MITLNSVKGRKVGESSWTIKEWWDEGKEEEV
jgi:hypothetical protein